MKLGRDVFGLPAIGEFVAFLRADCCNVEADSRWNKRAAGLEESFSWRPEKTQRRRSRNRRKPTWSQMTTSTRSGNAIWLDFPWMHTSAVAEAGPREGLAGGVDASRATSIMALSSMAYTWSAPSLKTQ
jgi:hypothetical protein